MENRDFSVTIYTNSLIRILWITAAILAFAGFSSQLFSHLTGHGVVYGLIRLFNLGGEQNIPAFFSSTMLLFASLLVGIVATATRTLKRPYAKHWAILSIGFAYLAVDEAASIHELLFRPTRELIGGLATGFFYWSWVIPGIGAVVLVGLFFNGFLTHLAVRTRTLFLCAAAIYLGGAIGVEMIEGYYYEIHGNQTLAYSMIYSIEESLEMAGIIVFLYGVLDYITNNLGDLKLKIL